MSDCNVAKYDSESKNDFTLLKSTPANANSYKLRNYKLCCCLVYKGSVYKTKISV